MKALRYKAHHHSYVLLLSSVQCQSKISRDLCNNPVLWGNALQWSLLQNEQNRNFVISTKGRNLNKYIAI